MDGASFESLTALSGILLLSIAGGVTSVVVGAVSLSTAAKALKDVDG